MSGDDHGAGLDLDAKVHLSGGSERLNPAPLTADQLAQIEEMAVVHPETARRLVAEVRRRRAQEARLRTLADEWRQAEWVGLIGRVVLSIEYGDAARRLVATLDAETSDAP